MAKLIYNALTSLDGYVADDNGDFAWAVPGEEVHALVNELESVAERSASVSMPNPMTSPIYPSAVRRARSAARCVGRSCATSGGVGGVPNLMCCAAREPAPGRAAPPRQMKTRARPATTPTSQGAPFDSSDAAVFLNILTAVDGSSSSCRALEQAIEIARAMNSKLTLITVAPPPSPYVARAGVSSETMRNELDNWAERILAEALAAIPDDVIAHTVRRSGHAGPEIEMELERGHYDLVVLGSRGRGRAREGLLGSVNGYLHFHSHVPLLSVPDDTD